MYTSYQGNLMMLSFDTPAHKILVNNVETDFGLQIFANHLI